MECLFIFISGKAVYSHVSTSLKVRSRCSSQRSEMEPAASKLPHAHTQRSFPALGNSNGAFEILLAFIKKHLIRFIMG